VAPTRRETLRAAVAAVAGGLAFLGADPVSAKPRAKRRKRRRNKARARCLAACGPDCAICYYSPAGEVVCGQSATVTRCFPCEADRDCGGSRCIARFQARGGFRAERFSACNYPAGLCVDVETCPA
jgi:hypothetical protein